MARVATNTRGTSAQRAGRALHAALLERIEPGTPDSPLEDKQLAAVIADWSACNSFVDRNRCQENDRPCAAIQALCRGRCRTEYWIEHAELAAAVMAGLAARYRQDELLYWQVGRLHDLDYLAFPHDMGIEAEATHPVPLVRKLSKLNFTPRGCIALLEHAPYLGLGRHGDRLTQTLSLSLSVAEDAATLFATDRLDYFLHRMPETIAAILRALPLPSRMIELGRDRGRYRSIPRILRGNFTKLEAIAL